jgi:pimeloyl-ACP methyl ester carboxylesterase
LPLEAELFTALLAPQGFALAFSSYSENGWAVKDGVQRTHQLLGLFTSKFGKPTRVLLGGASMGALVAIQLAEKYPGAFAGLLCACAASGGSRLQFDYLAHTRALFDVMYPGELPGTAGRVPAGIDIPSQIVGPAADAMVSDGGGGALIIAAMDQSPVPGADATEVADALLTALAGHAGAFSDLATKLPRGDFFDNTEVAYTSAALPATTLADINAAVGRFEASPAALNYLEQHYQPSGALEMPMLMISNARDPVVPGIHRSVYAALVDAAGRSDLLVQRTFPDYGHCLFTPEQIGTAFADLVLWVQFGFKPSP